MYTYIYVCIHINTYVYIHIRKKTPQASTRLPNTPTAQRYIILTVGAVPLYVPVLGAQDAGDQLLLGALAGYVARLPAPMAASDDLVVGVVVEVARLPEKLLDLVVSGLVQIVGDYLHAPQRGCL